MKKQIQKLLLGGLIALLLCTAVFAENKVQVRTATEAEQALLSCIAQRQTSITLQGWSENVRYQDEDELIMLLRRACANDEQTNGSGSDYDVMNVYTVICNLQDDALTVHFTYLTTQKQEQELDEKCAEILQELNLAGLSDYEKVEKIYEYVGTHFVYDDSLTTFSAYSGLKSGKMVCQGYALLLHKLLWAQGIACRIISGTTGATLHGWNIVQLDEKWYNLDVTWDACEQAGEAMEFACFLRCNEHFAGHIPHAPYLTAAFQAKHPIARQDYDFNEIVCMLQNEALSGLTIRMGKTAQITAKNTKNEPLSYTFRSTDPSVAEIDQNGRLCPKKLGTCSIIVTANKPGVVPAMWKLTTVDLTKASAWAQQDVEAYYLAGLLPESLCADFQKPITRAELTRLLYPVLQAIPARWSEGIHFGDIFRSKDAQYIEYAAYLGIVSGTGNGRFSPDTTLTREQAAKILFLTANQLGEALPEPQGKTWTDGNELAEWAVGFADSCNAAGIMQGTGGGRFSPKRALTREQMICMLARLLDWCIPAQQAA